MGEPALKNRYHSKCTVYVVVSVVHSMGLEKCEMTSIRHYYITQSIFTALKVLCASPTLLPLSPNLGNHLPFAVSVALSFLECHMIGITHYVDFSDHLFFFFLLVICISGSSMTFHGLINFIALKIFHCLDVPRFIYLFTY